MHNLKAFFFFKPQAPTSIVPLSQQHRRLFLCRVRAKSVAVYIHLDEVPFNIQS